VLFTIIFLNIETFAIGERFKNINTQLSEVHQIKLKGKVIDVNEDFHHSNNYSIQEHLRVNRNNQLVEDEALALHKTVSEKLNDINHRLLESLEKKEITEQEFKVLYANMAKVKKENDDRKNEITSQNRYIRHKTKHKLTHVSLALLNSKINNTPIPGNCSVNFSNKELINNILNFEFDQKRVNGETKKIKSSIKIDSTFSDQILNEYDERDDAIVTTIKTVISSTDSNEIKIWWLADGTIKKIMVRQKIGLIPCFDFFYVRSLWRCNGDKVLVCEDTDNKTDLDISVIEAGRQNGKIFDKAPSDTTPVQSSNIKSGI